MHSHLNESGGIVNKIYNCSFDGFFTSCQPINLRQVLGPANHTACTKGFEISNFYCLGADTDTLGTERLRETQTGAVVWQLRKRSSVKFED